MSTVVSVGSCNLDRTVRLDGGAAATLADRYDWFPPPGVTRTVESVPSELDERVDSTTVGGKGANQAVAAAKAGADAAFLGAVGPDGDRALDALDERGVDASAVERSEVRTGTAYVFVEPDGENRIAVVPGANREVTPAVIDERFERIRAADCLLLQNEIPLDANDHLLSRLDGLASPPTVVLDPAPADGTGRLLGHAPLSVITPNEREYRALRPALPDFPGRTVVTRGGDDVRIENGGQHYVPVPPADTADTTGAGDTFAGYLAARLAAGDALRDAAAEAARAAALATEREGAQPAIPERSSVVRRDE